MKGNIFEQPSEPAAVDVDENEARLIGQIVAEIMGAIVPQRPGDGSHPLAEIVGDRQRFESACRPIGTGGCTDVHAACRTRLDAASDARLSRVAHPFEANVSHWSLGILSRNIQERTVWGETEHMPATVSGVPACFTIDA